MEKDLHNSLVDDSSYLQQSDTEQSFVGKFKSIITNTSISKWFRKQDDTNKSVRRREDFEDEEIRDMQPPYKKVKLPTQETNCNTLLFKETSSVLSGANETNKKCDFTPEPVAGPSGIQTRKINNSNSVSASSVRNTFNSGEVINEHKDSDSEESTSGYSSVARIGSKEHVCESQPTSKQTSPLQHTPNNTRSLFERSKSSTMNRSLFAERTTSPNMNMSLSSRRPSFNVSSFGSPNFLDKTLLTKNIINSPFYSGRTIYGGASAYGSNLGRSAKDLKMSLKNPIQIKPVNKTTENGNVILGKTARRILETLEQYSSPVNDAKKIPTVSKKSRTEGLLKKFIGANPYSRESKISSNKELHVPSVSDLLKMKQKTRLQDSTEAVRQIAVNSKSNLNTTSYHLSTTVNEKEKHTGKIKTKITAVRQKSQYEQVAPIVNLNPISLPITTLPKFDLVIPPPTAATTKLPEKTVDAVAMKSTLFTSSTPVIKAQPQKETIETERNVQKQVEISSTLPYKFSDPIIIAENNKSIVAINNYKFSEPLKLEHLGTVGNVSANFKMPENKLPLPKTKNNGETTIKPAAVLKTGSVMDILGKKKEENLMEKFKPEVGTWECSICLIRNSSDKVKCAACETLKSTPVPSNDKKEFGNQFKLTTDKWECPICMIRNNSTDIKCVACQAPKPASKPNTKPALKTNTKPALKTDTKPETNKTLPGFGNAFKLPNNMWECPACMVRNKNEVTKCMACETVNPKSNISISSSAWGSKFQAPASSWECSACLVRNKEDATKCVACETPKTNSKSQTSSGFGDSFKVKGNEWECKVCMVRNKSENIKCMCCEAPKPGETLKSVSTSNKPIAAFNFGIDKASANTFSFGIPSNAKTEIPQLNVKPSTIFGEKAKPSTSTSDFSFGIPAQTQNKEKLTESTLSNTTTTPVLSTSNPLLKASDKLPEEAKPAPANFKFGVSATTSVAPTVSKASENKETISSVSSSSETPKPLFNFTPTTNNENLFNKADSSKLTNTTSVGNKPTNLFAFGAKPAATATPLVSQNIQKKEATHLVTSTSLFKFGSNSTPAVYSATTFGSSNVTSTNNAFGSTNPIKFDSTSTPSFKTPSANPTAVKPFSFGSTANNNDEPASKVPMFSFGQSPSTSATSRPSQSSGFSFASTNNAPATFNFSTGTANSFGSTSQKTSSGTFNFGSSTSSANVQKAGFNFGAAAASSTTPQSGFNFGSAASSSSKGFSFTTQPPAFDAAAKPTFNFSEGNVAFSAQPSAEGSVSQRKIKRAVRRTQR